MNSKELQQIKDNSAAMLNTLNNEAANLADIRIQAMHKYAHSNQKDDAAYQAYSNAFNQWVVVKTAITTLETFISSLKEIK